MTEELAVSWAVVASVVCVFVRGCMLALKRAGALYVCIVCMYDHQI